MTPKYSSLLCSVIFVNFFNNFFNNDVIIYRHLSVQEIVNWVTTADGCVHTVDTTQLDSFVASASAVCIGRKGSRVINRGLRIRVSVEKAASL